MTWTIIEPGTYLIASCLPALRPLIPMVQQLTKGTSLSILSSRRSRMYGGASVQPDSENIALGGREGLGYSGSQFGAGPSIEEGKGSFTECNTGDERSSMTSPRLDWGVAGSLHRKDSQMTETSRLDGIRIKQDYLVTRSGQI